jgi:hypothetical protein
MDTSAWVQEESEGGCYTLKAEKQILLISHIAVNQDVPQVNTKERMMMYSTKRTKG